MKSPRGFVVDVDAESERVIAHECEFGDGTANVDKTHGCLAPEACKSGKVARVIDAVENAPTIVFESLTPLASVKPADPGNTIAL